MLRLVDVRAHGHDAGDACRIGLAGSRAGSVHDGVFGGAEEIGASTEAVEHTASHDAGGVCVGVDVDLNRRVHSNDSQASDDFGAVGHLLAAKEKLGCIVIPVLVEAAEAFRGKANRRCGCEVEVARVEEVKERVLKDFGPYLQVLEVGTAGLSTG